MQYRRKIANFEAFQYNGETLANLPDWLKKYTDRSALGGVSDIGRTLTGTLLIPHPGNNRKADNGDWIVLENGKAEVYRDAEFKAQFEPVPDDVVTFTAQVGSPLAEAARTLEPVGPGPTPAVVIPTAPDSAAGAPDLNLTRTTSDAALPGAPAQTTSGDGLDAYRNTTASDLAPPADASAGSAESA